MVGSEPGRAGAMEEGVPGRSRHGGGTPPLTRDATPNQKGNEEEVPSPLSPPRSGFLQVPVVQRIQGAWELGDTRERRVENGSDRGRAGKWRTTFSGCS